jgi:ABC-type nitrate/sulfonate/bicarbonate transport system substrate-binding protein
MAQARGSLSRRGAIKLGVSGIVAGALAFRGTPAIAQAPTVVNFQLSWIKSAQYAGYFAGIERGFYREERIDPNFVSGGPGIDAIANVAAGQSAVGDRPSGTLIVARDRGLPIKVIGSAYQRSPGAIMSLAAKPVRTIRELEGKTFALPNTARPIVMQMLRDANIDPARVNMVPVGTDPGMLATGQVDAYYGLSTNQGIMLRTRGVQIHELNFAEAGAANMGGVIYGRENFLTENRDATVRFLRASIRGWAWALDNPEAAGALMVEKYGAPGLDLKAQVEEIRASKPFFEWGVGGRNGLLSLDVAYLQKEIDDYRKVDLIRSRLTAAEMCDDTLVAAAQPRRT